jgi:hypothetical protein
MNTRKRISQKLRNQGHRDGMGLLSPPARVVPGIAILASLGVH